MRKLDYPNVLCRTQPGILAFLVMFGGFILLALSFVWDVGQVQVQLQKTAENGGTILKEVGFSSALNWSLALTLVLPAALLYLCKVYQTFPVLLRALAVNRMVVTEELEPVPAEELKRLWMDQLARHRRWLLLLILVGTLFSLWEWYHFSARPLYLNNLTSAPELDWSVGALLDSNGEFSPAPRAERFANGTLSLLAFLGQSVILAALLTFMYKALIVSAFFSTLSRPEGPHRLVPDLRSRDPRLGFECFTPFLESSMICIGIFYALFYLSRLQNIYLRSDEPSILGFLKDRLLLGLVNGAPLDMGAATEVFRLGVQPEPGDTLDFSSIMVGLGAFAVLMVAAFMIGSTVRDSAVRARDELDTGLQTRPEKVRRLTSLTADRTEKALEKMVVWPVRYLRAREFFGMIVLGATCIFFYKLGMILVGLLIFRVFWDVARYILGPVEKDAPAAPAGS